MRYNNTLFKHNSQQVSNNTWFGKPHYKTSLLNQQIIKTEIFVTSELLAGV